MQSTTSGATSKTSTLKSLLVYKWCAMYGMWRNRKSVSTSLVQFPSVSEPQIFQVLQTAHPFFFLCILVGGDISDSSGGICYHCRFSVPFCVSCLLVLICCEHYLNFMMSKLPCLMEDVPLETRRRIFLQHDSVLPYFSYKYDVLEKFTKIEWFIIAQYLG